MSDRVYLNDNWKFQEVYTDAMKNWEYDDAELPTVRLPHTVCETPLHYFDEHSYQMESGYRRVVKVPEDWRDKKLLLTVDGAAHACEVFWNGEKVGEHHCGYTAFTMDVTEKVIVGDKNILTVRVDSRESLNIPPFGFVVDYMTYGGLYREVWLDVKEKHYIADAFVHGEVPGDLPNEGTKVTLISQITLNEKAADAILRQSIRRCGEETYELLGEQSISGKRETMAFSAGDTAADGTASVLADIKLWDIDDPNLYEVKTELLVAGEVVDEKVVTTGFRSAVFRADGFYLNGRKVKLRGLNRHQSYPYVGYAMPESMQKNDADILKYELGVNAVRTSHYPQSHYFLERCDEIGLLIFTEMPGWQHIGDEAWKEQAVKNVGEMVTQYRNHTSIILWGVRINESGDDDAFYTKTNALAHELDPTRPTGGVRAHKKSSLLEDVYTYNDFVHSGKNQGCEPKKNVTSDMTKPYLISEYNGHMYPTKSFDWEEHRVEHALRHVRVLDAVAGEDDIAGSFGWCMFDYNTHKDFGSGDRICYHGVMDMFRNPKLAANVYACQQEKTPVLSLSSTMDIGEHPGCNRGETYIFTNADRVKMYKNDRFIKEYKKEDSPYRHLPHGPLVVDDFIGNAIAEGEHFKPAQEQGIKDALNATARFGLSNLPKSVYLIALKMILVYHMKPEQAVVLYNKYIGDWGGASTTYRFEAIKDGEVVAEIKKEPMRAVHLVAKADHTQLRETSTYDVAAIRIEARDENENLLTFFNEPLEFFVDGPAQIIGPSIASMQGGMGGTYIKTTGTCGTVTLTIKNQQTKDVVLSFEVTEAVKPEV